MKKLWGETIVPKFNEYSYICEDDSKPELIWFWIRTLITILKKKTIILIDYIKTNVMNMNGVYYFKIYTELHYFNAKSLPYVKRL